MTFMREKIRNSPFCATLFKDPNSKVLLFKAAFSRGARSQQILTVKKSTTTKIIYKGMRGGAFFGLGIFYSSSEVEHFSHQYSIGSLCSVQYKLGQQNYHGPKCPFRGPKSIFFLPFPVSVLKYFL